MFFIHEMFIVYKLETLKNCKEVKHIIMTITIIYIVLFYVVFDQKMKNTFRKSSAPYAPSTWKNPLPPKNSKSATPLFLLTLKIFQVPLQKEGGKTLWLLTLSFSLLDHSLLHFHTHHQLFVNNHWMPLDFLNFLFH